jgi:branched-chain amino acid transport system ATP-binding protein
LLSVEHLGASYGPLPVLHDVSLEVGPGEMVALIGANNAGKSTLLRTIVGLHRPSAGRVVFDGRDITTIPAHEIANVGVALVPEGRGLFPEMTVEENLLMGGHVPRARSARAQMIESVYALFPVLKERHRQLASTLSGGQQQMLAVGRGLVSKPRILLLDEPSWGLAPLLIRELFAVLKELNGRGLAILLVEQNIRFSLELSRRSYVLLHGRVHLSGDSKALIGDERVRKAYLGIAE